MISDKRLQLCEDFLLTTASGAPQFVTNAIDLGMVRDWAEGQPLYSVITVKTGLTLTTGHIINFFTALTVAAGTAAGALPWTNYIVGGAGPFADSGSTLISGRKICFPFAPVLGQSQDAPSTPAVDTGGDRFVQGFLYPVILATGAVGIMTGGTIDWDVCLQSDVGAVSGISTRRQYAAGFIV